MMTEQLAPKWAGQFDSFVKWINHANIWLQSPSQQPAVCIDAKGRRCSTGKDFMRARDEGTFPVRYFWEFEVCASHECGSVPDDDELRHLVAIKLAEQDGADPFQVIWQGNPPEPYDAMYGEYMGRALEIIAIVKSGISSPSHRPNEQNDAVQEGKQ